VTLQQPQAITVSPGQNHNHSKIKHQIDEKMAILKVSELYSLRNN